MGGEKEVKMLISWGKPAFWPRIDGPVYMQGLFTKENKVHPEAQVWRAD